jgi:hypothetical protein
VAHDSRCDVDRDTGDVVASNIDIADVDTYADVHVVLGQSFSDQLCGFNRTGRRRDKRQHAVARELNDTATLVKDASPNGLIVDVEKILPLLIAGFDRSLGGGDEVCEQDRCNETLRSEGRWGARNELGDIGHQRVNVTSNRIEIRSGNLNEPCARNLGGDFRTASS